MRVACHVKTHNSNMLPSLPLGLKDYKRELKSLHSYLKTKMPAEVLMPLGNTFCHAHWGWRDFEKHYQETPVHPNAGVGILLKTLSRTSLRS